MQKEVILSNGVYLEVTKGNIIQQEDMEAIVNAANAFLRNGGGVAGIIHKFAGPELEKEATKSGPIKPGEAVITKAYNLPNKYVIHVLGPVYDRDIPHDELLARAYKNALKLCEENEIESVAFPAISTGAFGYPPEEAAPIAIGTLFNELQHLQSLKTIRMVNYSENDFILHKDALERYP
jgi:O-acetyl-ADP-ribose deacetylase (regulator of RNase III)